MSPFYYDNNTFGAGNVRLSRLGELNAFAVWDEGSTAAIPIINLSAEAAQSLIGSGSTEDPYYLAE